MPAATDLVGFYDDAYSRDPADAARYSRWRALSAVGKADHVLALYARRAPAPAAAPVGAPPPAPAPAPAPASVLEVGCGDGALLSELHRRWARARLAGVEITEAAVTIARERAEIDLVELYDGRRLPFGDRAFDLGILSHVLEHVHEPPALLAEVARVCSAVVVEVPLEANWSARRAGKTEHAAEVGHIQRLDRAAARSIVTRAGLSIAAEIEDPLPLEVHRFFATTAAARTSATARWAVRDALHRLLPPLARRAFTLHYACLCLPPAG